MFCGPGVNALQEVRETLLNDEVICLPLFGARASRSLNRAGLGFRFQSSLSQPHYRDHYLFGMLVCEWALHC